MLLLSGLASAPPPRSLTPTCTLRPHPGGSSASPVLALRNPLGAWSAGHRSSVGPWAPPGASAHLRSRLELGAGSWEQASRSPRPGRQSAPVLGGARHASSGRASSGRGREGRSAPSPSGRAGAPGRALSTHPPRRHPCHVAPPRDSLGPRGPVPDLRGAPLHPVLC